MAIEEVYRPRNPEENPLYRVVAGHLETFLARQRERDRNVPEFVEREFRAFIDCGVLFRGSYVTTAMSAAWIAWFRIRASGGAFATPAAAGE